MNDLLLRIRQRDRRVGPVRDPFDLGSGLSLRQGDRVQPTAGAGRNRDPIALPYPRSQQVRFTPAFTTAERLASEALGVIAPPAEEVAA